MKTVRNILMLICAVWAFMLTQRLLVPKYMSGVYEGALTAEYYDSEKNHQVLFVGDCEVYENFSPIELWRGYGITSYIRGGAQQLIWQSYYLLEDALRYETPDAVVFNVLSMKYGEPQSEAYNRLNLEGMRPSAAKLGAVKASMTGGEDILSYFLPVLRYHERWKELTADDVKYFLKKENVSHNGFMMRCDTKPADVMQVGLRLADYTLSEVCFEYLDKMTELCAEKGIRLILIKAPSISPYWYSQWDEQVVRYAEEHGLLYLNFLDLAEEIGIDFDTDTYDAGLHLNVYGAEKLTAYFGAVLSGECGLPDLRGDAETAAAWAVKERRYDAMKAAQEAELAEYGEIKTFKYK